MTEPSQPEPDVHPTAERMSPVTARLLLALEQFWASQPDPLRTFDLWAMGGIHLLVRADGPAGVAVDVVKSDDVRDAPKLGIGQYL
jgi:hypothetical protein